MSAIIKFENPFIFIMRKQDLRSILLFLFYRLLIFMQREIQDKDGTIWSCVEAYSGLSQNSENKDAARVEDKSDLVYVVCTPNGGAQTVRLELQSDWENALSDEDLLREIEKNREK